MGYYASHQGSQVVIKRENIPEALLVLKKMFEVEEGKKSPSFSWVDADTVMKAETLSDALAEWRWDTSFSDEGDLVDVTFSGEKLGDDEDLWFHLAPLVEHGGYIEMLGEDDSRWRWVFWRGEFRTEYPHITWPYEQVTPAMELAEAMGAEYAETA
jgi:hypothetical protein